MTHRRAAGFDVLGARVESFGSITAALRGVKQGWIHYALMPRLTRPHMASGSLAGLAQPVIDAGSFVLRPWLAADASALVAGYSDPGIRQWHAQSMTISEARAWIEAWPSRWQDETGGGWAIAEDGSVLGQIAFRTIDLNDGAAELSYWVLPDARGRGVAPEAVIALTKWSFEVLGLHRIEINHSTQNPASCRVAERAGYGAEGVKQSQVLHLDGWHDMHQHARIAPGLA